MNSVFMQPKNSLSFTKTGFIQSVRKVVIFFSVSNPIKVFKQLLNIRPFKIHVPKGASTHLPVEPYKRHQWNHSVGELTWV